MIAMTSTPTTVDRMSEAAWAAAAALLPRVTLALLILIAGALIASWAARAVSAALAETGRVDETARPALASAARYGVLIVTFLAALS
jgi:hypothetical protein